MPCQKCRLSLFLTFELTTKCDTECSTEQFIFKEDIFNKLEIPST